MTKRYPNSYLLPHKRTYPMLVPREDTRGRTVTNCKQKICRQKSGAYSARQQKTRTRPWIRIMDQRPKFPEKKPGTTLMLVLRTIPPLLVRIFFPDQISHMGTTIRTMEHHMSNAQISHSQEAMEIDLEMKPSTIRMERGETMEDFLVLQRPKGETSQKNCKPPTTK